MRGDQCYDVFFYRFRIVDIPVIIIDKNLKKRDLQTLANVSGSSIAKLGRNENVNTDILLRICSALQCDISDIMEIEERTDDKKE